MSKAGTDPTTKFERDRERLRQWRAANRDRFNASSRAARKKRPERVKAAYAKWLAANKEAERERGKAYRAKNGDGIRAKERQKYVENREKHHKKNVSYYARNADRRKQQRKEWGAKNPEMARALGRRRRARALKAGGSHTVEDIRSIHAAQRGRCAGCNAHLNGKFEVDHIIALSKGGSDNRKNLQLMCGPCNRSKKDNPPEVFNRRMGRLL